MLLDTCATDTEAYVEKQNVYCFAKRYSVPFTAQVKWMGNGEYQVWARLEWPNVPTTYPVTSKEIAEAMHTPIPVSRPVVEPKPSAAEIIQAFQRHANLKGQLANALSEVSRIEALLESSKERVAQLL